jgi:23S rRNA pseudouridine1911/1915/1917 synthase
MRDIKIIHEEKDYLVIEKPAGLVVNRADSVKEETLQDWMENKFSIFNFQFPNKEEEEFINRSGLVHRLDKETSGLMVLAKTAQTFQNLKNQFKTRQTAKKYLALVHGNVEPKTGTINLPLARNIFNRHKFCVSIDGKMAKTKYKVLKNFEATEKHSLVEVKILTGRTHQIRVHFSHLGYPLVSDPLYLGKRLKDDLIWCPRIFLHAAYLSFFHPQSGEKLEFESELPEDLEKALKTLS